jgi:multimeric flavodoxin WrbA
MDHVKKILGIVGSPRRLGNCEIMVKEISRHIAEPHEMKLLRLSDFDLRPCRGCYRCLFDEGGCPQEDDFYSVLNEIIDTDAVILAAPTYFLGPNGCLKLFIDRGLSFYAQTEALWGKPSVGVGIAGMGGKEGYTMLGIQSFLKIILSEVKLCKLVYGALPGDIFLNAENKRVAAELASALFEPIPEKQSPACPLCGGDTFRFIDKDRIRCMLCSNAGRLSFQAGTPVFHIEMSGHELFLTKQGVLNHRRWLKGMKVRFVEQKNALKEITAPYRKEGHWIKPQKQ